jgi:ABC-type dipeptide/oligopeptide/nickel transport system permease subunit
MAQPEAAPWLIRRAGAPDGRAEARRPSVCGDPRVVGGGIVAVAFPDRARSPPPRPARSARPGPADSTCRRPGSPGGEPGYLLGTDSLGRDILSRLIHGARIAVIVALVAASLACLIGSLLGLPPVSFGAGSTVVVSRLIDVWMAFPPVLLSIVLAAAVGAGLGSVMLAIVVIDWTRFARVVRAEVMVQRQQDYVAAAAPSVSARWPIAAEARSCPTCCRCSSPCSPRDGHRGDRRGDPVLRRAVARPTRRPGAA